MKKAYLTAWIWAAVLLAAGCAREIETETPTRGDIVFRLSVGNMTTRTSATSDENNVESLDLFVFSADGTTKLYYSHLDSENLVTENDDYVVSTGLSTDATTADEVAKWNTGITGSNIEQAHSALMSGARVYAVANYSGAGDLSTVSSVTALENTVADAEGFLLEDSDGWKVKTSPSFVMMSDEGTFGKVDGQNKIESAVTLTRLASKVSLDLSYPSSLPIQTADEDYNNRPTMKIWEPLSGENARVYLDNGALTTLLGGPADSPESFHYADHHPLFSDTSLEPLVFYTYPFSWEDDVDRAPFLKIIQPWHYRRVYSTHVEGEPDNVVVEENVVELYYKVMFPRLSSLTANTLYKFTVGLNVLGGEVENPVILTPPDGLSILDWGTAFESPADVEPVKYLVVETNKVNVEEGGTVSVIHKVEVENGGAVSIMYKATNKPTLSVQSIYKDVYTNDNTARKYIFNPEISGFKSEGIQDDFVGIDHDNDASNGPVGTVHDDETGAWFVNEFDPGTHEGTIRLTHKLSSVFNDANFAARPYIYKLTLTMPVDDQGNELVQNIEITQVPPIYVQGDMSTGWVCINGHEANDYGNFYASYQKRTTAWTGDKPMVYLPTGTTASAVTSFIYTKWVLGNTTSPPSATSVNNLGSIGTYDYLTGSNACQWRIIIRSVTSNDLYITDPRVDISADSNHDNDLSKIINAHTNSTTNNNRYGNKIDGSPLGSNNADYTLIKKYQPGGTTEKVIAPEVMFASSYGKSVSINYLVAVLRCAAYQEDGFPAGRWRLPTEKEIEVAIKLAAKGAIPELFLPAGRYWASSGKYIYNSNSGTSQAPNWVWATPSNAEKTFYSNNSNYSLGARCVYDTWYWGRDEVNELKTSNYGNPSYPQYNWSGWNYTRKPTN